MKRSLSIAIVLLIGVSLAVPTAQASRADPKHTRYRYFEDLGVTGLLPGRIVFGVLYQENHRGEFTPRKALGYNLVGTFTCTPGGVSVFGIGGNAFSKYGYFDETLTNGHFDHTLGSELPDPSSIKGDLSGTVLKRLKRGGRIVRTARVNGTFNVEAWDPFGRTPVHENCTSADSYSATPCKRRMSSRAPNFSRWKRWKVPICQHLPW